jgi:Mrp family chromosome partitioning ATPase/capsular polysaccharide biosynthesis protein
MEKELTIYDYWRIVVKHRFTIVISVIVMLVATYVFTELQKPVYKATSAVKIDISSIPSSMMIDPIGAEIRIIKSEEVIKKALDKLGLKDSIAEIQSQLNVEQVGYSNIVQITAYADNPNKVSGIVNAITESYIEKSTEERNKAKKQQKEYILSQLTRQEEELRKAEENLKNFKAKGGISGLASAYASRLIELNSQLSNLLNSYTEEHPEVIKKKREIKFVEEQIKSLSEQDMELIRLTREVNINESLYNNLKKQYQEAEIAEAGKIEVSTIISRAVPPKYPIKPNKKLNLIIGFFLGLIIGSVASLFLESLDTTIGTVEDLETFIGLPILGIIPHAPDESKKSKLLLTRFLFKKRDRLSCLRENLILWHSAKLGFVESYHTLRANISFHISKGNKKSLIFTSAGPGEGKTFCLINYALSSAETGLQVILIEADLRRPTISKIFGLNRENGLSDILVGSILWKDALKGTSDFLMSGLKLDNIIKVPGIENLKVITCGRRFINPIDIINSPNMPSLIDELKANFDLVLLDCPPVLLFADATILSSKVDTVVLVYQAGRTSKIALKRAKSQLDNVKANILGIVLNDVKMEMIPHYYGSYYYSSKYYKEEKKST